MNIKRLSFILILVAQNLHLLSLPIPLSRVVAIEKREEIIHQWKEQQRIHLLQNIQDCAIRQDGLIMPFSLQTFGTTPPDGRSLYISMHGGGNVATPINDSQWENQKHLYQPDEGIYICPRAPWDDWDMWFKPPIDSMIEELIRTCVTCCGVNPDKVYLMGYSAGGDGVWRLAPRMADHWAAASMMAGHPGDVGLDNLFNLPFLIWCGQFDNAYNRREEVEKRGKQLDSLQHKHPQGYVHQTHIIQKKAHWMDLEDKAALPWMSRYHRNPYPRHITWVQEEGLRNDFYWIGIRLKEAKRGNTVIADIEGNSIMIHRCDYKHLIIYINDLMLNLDKTIRIVYQGKIVYKGKPVRTVENIRNSLNRRGDTSFCFPTILEVDL